MTPIIPSICPSPFGIGGDHLTTQAPEKWIPQMAAIGIRVNRSPHTNWDNVQPGINQWNWEPCDRRVRFIMENGIDTGGLLVGYPEWAGPNRDASGRGRMPVDNLPAWSTYVFEAVKRYKGKINRWEVWNEPPNFTGADQTAADYAKLVVSAHEAAKAADPDCLIGLAAKSVHINYLEQAIRAGAKDRFDFITVHPYETLNGVLRNQGTEAIFMSIVPNIRRMLGRVNPAKTRVPVIITELGADSDPPGTNYGVGPDVAAQALVKAFTMSIAQGVDCIQWFEGMDGDSGAMGLLDASGKPRPTYTALEQMIRHLGSTPACLGWQLLNNKHYAFLFEGAAGPLLITWAYKGAPDLLDFGAPVTVVHPLTGESAHTQTCDLTASPVIVTGIPSGLVDAAKANRHRPFPWEGDYSHARDVSIAFGEKTEAKGLHTQAGDEVAKAVLAYGGSARAGDVPGGNMFMIDPNFLCGDPVPVRISAVVRRNEANDVAGFRLYYESPNGRDGYKASSEWFPVPDNKQWHTATFELHDAQFVGMYGYSFSLQSDEQTQNKYLIKSVTIEKME